jgi:hypothetical protein
MIDRLTKDAKDNSGNRSKMFSLSRKPENRDPKLPSHGFVYMSKSEPSKTGDNINTMELRRGLGLIKSDSPGKDSRFYQNLISEAQFREDHGLDSNGQFISDHTVLDEPGTSSYFVSSPLPEGLKDDLTALATEMVRQFCIIRMVWGKEHPKQLIIPETTKTLIKEHSKTADEHFRRQSLQALFQQEE